jgi:hypothetical protein
LLFKKSFIYTLCVVEYIINVNICYHTEGDFMINVSEIETLEMYLVE